MSRRELGRELIARVAERTPRTRQLLLPFEHSARVAELARDLVEFERSLRERDAARRPRREKKSSKRWESP